VSPLLFLLNFAESPRFRPHPRTHLPVFTWILFVWWLGGFSTSFFFLAFRVFKLSGLCVWHEWVLSGSVTCQLASISVGKCQYYLYNKTVLQLHSLSEQFTIR